MGGKYRLGKHLVPYVLRHKPKRIIEPFLGGANFTTHIFKTGFSGEYIAGDYNPDVSYMWREVIENGWLPGEAEMPDRETYYKEKVANYSDNPLRGFMRTAASFSGKPWDAYGLKDKDNNYSRNYWDECVRAITNQAELYKGNDIKIVGGDYSFYFDYLTSSSVVYCDPPYVGTVDYNTNFDTDLFWMTMESWSEICPVYVSELVAPVDWIAVYTKKVKHSLDTTVKKEVSEKLFLHKSWDSLYND